MFKETEWGWFQAHAYRFDDDASTFIVETPEAVWRAAGLDRHEQRGRASGSARRCSRTCWTASRCLTNDLRGGPIWINFPRVANRTWVKDNLVLMGDAAHSAHFSIGSGTKLALEDAIALARLIWARAAGARCRRCSRPTRPSARSRCCGCSRRRATRPSGSRTSPATCICRPSSSPTRCSTRSQRVSHENLRLRDQALARGLRALVRRAGRPAARSAGGPADVHAVPAARLELANRVVVSPMAIYSADGRRAGRPPSRPSRRARAGRRRAGLHRDDLRLARRAGSRPAARACGTTSRRSPGRGSCASSTSTARPSSACSSAIAGPRARPGSAGRGWTSRSRTATGR